MADNKYLKIIKNGLYNLLLIIKNGHYLKQFGFFISKDEIPSYWWSGKDNKNFGDTITPYLIKKISGKKPVWVNKYCMREYYMVTGSILSDANKNAVIWGNGIMSRYQNIKKPKKILAVRGPLTRERLLELGYNCPKVYGDPALLLPLFYKPKVKKKYELGVIPHYEDYNEIKSKVSKSILIINLLDDIEKVLDEILSCKRTVSTSLHGIIVSHAYNIPSLWGVYSKKTGGDNIKFSDYFQSIGIKEYTPINLKKELENTVKIIKLIDKKYRNKINFNHIKLLESCPFI